MKIITQRVWKVIYKVTLNQYNEPEEGLKEIIFGASFYESIQRIVNQKDPQALAKLIGTDPDLNIIHIESITESVLLEYTNDI